MMLVNIIQHRGTVGIFNYRMFVKESNIKKLSFNLHNNFYDESSLVLCNNGSFWSSFYSVLLILKYFVSKNNEYEGVSIFVFILIQLWVGIWLYTLVNFSQWRCGS